MQTAIGFVGFWILSHYVGPSEYGVIGMASTITAVLGIFGDGGAGSALVRSRDAGPSAQATAFWLSLGGATGIAIVGALASPMLGNYYQQPGVTALAVALSFGFLLAVPGRVSNALMSRELRFREISTASILSSAAAVLLAWWIASTGAGPWAIAAQLLAAQAIQSGLLLAFRRYEISPRAVRRETFRSLGGFSSRITAYTFLMAVGRSGDVVLGGRLLGPAAPGMLATASRLGFIPVQRLAWSVSAVFLPALTRLDGSGFKLAFQGVLRLLMLVVGPACAFVIAAAPEILSILPDRWSGLSPVLRAVAAGALLEPVATLAWAVLVASGRPGRFVRGAVLFLPVAWTGALLGSLAGSATWLAVTWAVTNSLWALGIAKLAREEIGPVGAWVTGLRGPAVFSVILGLSVRFALNFAKLQNTSSGLALALVLATALSGLAAATVFRDDIAKAARLLQRT